MAEEVIYFTSEWVLTGGAMFRDHAKPRAGVEKFASAGEEIFVTSTHQPRKFTFIADVAQLVEHVHGKDGVTSSILVIGSSRWST